MSFRTLEELVIGATNTVFGEDVTYTPVSGSPVEIKGVLNNSWVDAEGMISLRPTLQIRLSDLSSAPRKGDSVTISSTPYRVSESRVDGYGGSTLILQKV